MSSATEADTPHAETTQVRRIGIVLSGLEDANLNALRFLILQMNRLQTTFEYEFLPTPDDVFLRDLRSTKTVDRGKIKEQIPAFSERYLAFLASENLTYTLQEAPADYFIVICLARFSDEYYSTRRGSLSVLALGNWERVMAPPSILEFILTLVVREAVASISPRLRGSIHLGTKGCVCDFTPDLGEARLKVLSAFVCDHCTRALSNDGFTGVAAEVRIVLNKQWLGQTREPGSPAAVVAKLGHNLFITKGLKATPWEKAVATLQEEGAKQVMIMIGTVLVAALLTWMGLKGP